MKRKMNEFYRKGVHVPESQRWILEEPHKSRIESGLAWAASTPPKETDLGKLLLRARKNSLPE